MIQSVRESRVQSSELRSVVRRMIQRRSVVPVLLENVNVEPVPQGKTAVCGIDGEEKSVKGKEINV